jgi:gliding motility-associated-like protein
MKKIFILLQLFCLLIFSSSLKGQTTFRFSYDVGAFDIAGGMIETPAGDFVIAGLNNSFGPYYGNAIKINSSGTVVWAKAYTGGFATNFSDIKNVSTGGYIITGSSTSGGGGALLVRLDAAGAVLWAKRYQLPDKPSANASSEYGNAVIETSDGGFLVGGGVDYFWDGVSATTTDTTSAMGFKVDVNGNLLWSKVWTIATANPDEHYINDVAEVSDGYFFVGQSSEGSGTLNSNGDYPSNSLVIKTTTAGALTYIRRWGAGNTTSQSINSALKLANGNLLLGGIDDVNAFLATMTGPGSTPATTGLNRKINGAAFPPRTLVIQDIMENSDGNYSVIGMQIEPLSFTFYTAIYKMNSSTGALIFGRGYTPIGLSSILPEGGLCSDQGYYVGMTDQQNTGFNYNVIRTDATGQLGAAAGCGSTSLNPGTASYSVTFSTPTSANFDLATATAFTPTVSTMTPTNVQHCLTTVCTPPAAATTVTATPSTICAGQSSTITASGAGSGVGYNVYTASTGGTNLGATPLVVSPGGTTTYYVESYLTATPTCVSTTRVSVTVTVTPAVTPTTGFSYTTPVCANGTNPTPITVGGFTSGGTYSSSAGLTLNSSTGGITLSSSTPGTYTVTYAVVASGCNPAGSSTTTITINPVTTPVTGFSYTTPVCANGTNPTPTTVGGFTSGGTYSSTAGLTVNSGTGVITLSSSTPGTYTVTYSVAASGCQAAGSSTTSITINPVTTPVTGFSYTTPVCANASNPSPASVGGFTSGGTYSSTSGLTVNSGTGVITLSSSTPGTYTVTYSVAASGCQAAGSSTTSITINPVTTPVTGFSYTTPVCANGTNPVPSPVGGFTSGGTYSSTGGLSVNVSSGVIDLSLSTPGTYSVTYSVAATACGPAGSSTTSITIDPTTTPVTGFSYATPVCANGTNPSPTPVGGFTSGGTYNSSAGLTVNSVNGNIDLSSSTPGTYTVTYSVSSSGCMVAGSSTTSITIDPTTAPTTGFSYTSPVCANGVNPAPTPVAGFTTGGSYSSTSGLTVDAQTGIIDLSSSTPGSYIITYTVAASGCMVAGTGTANITIDPTTTPNTTFLYTTPVCANGINPTPITGGGFTSGGAYNSTSGLTIDSGTGNIDLNTTTPGTYTVTYSVAASGCMAAGSGTTSITINPVTTPVTGFSYTSPVCANGTNPTPIPTGGFTNGGTYSSTSGITINSTTGVIDLSSSTPGTYTITYSVAATTCGPAGSSTSSITIDPVTIPVTGFSYTTPVCANGTNPVPAPSGGFASGGTYSSSAGLTVNVSSGIIDLSTSTPGTYTVTYSVAASGCSATGSSTTSITILPVIAPTTGFSYTTPVCLNGTNPTSIPVSGFTTGGTYSSTAGLSINAGTGAIDLSLSTSGTYTVTYTIAATACSPAGSSTASITINSVPIATAGSNVPCSGGALNLTSSGGTSYVWNGPAGFNNSTQNPTINTVTTSNAGTYTVTVSDANGCFTTATTSALINPSPAITITGITTICSGNSTTLTASGASTYSWNTGTLTPDITVNPAANSTYTVTGTDGNGCFATQTATVTITAPAVAAITGNPTVCSGESTTLTASGGSVFLWSTGETTSSITLNPVTSATYSVIVGSGCPDTATVNVTVNSNPVATITGNTTVILGSETTLTATGGTNYLWTPSDGLSCTVCDITTASPTVDMQYCVTATNANGCSDSTCVLVKVDIKCGELFVPTAFSPNGDNENDHLKIMIGYTGCIEDLNFAIFDRWGEKVFETSDLNMAVNTGWDGTNKGKPLDTNVFVYYLKAKVSGKDINEHGNITLVK